MSADNKIKINGHADNSTAEKPNVPKTDYAFRSDKGFVWTDGMIGVLGAMRYTLDKRGKRTTKWSLDRLAKYFGVNNTNTISEALSVYQCNEKKYDKAAEAYILPNTKAGRATWATIKKKEGGK